MFLQINRLRPWLKQSSPLTSRSNGFSLLELLVVMGVIGVLVALAVPQLSSPGPSRKAAAFEVVRVIELARTRAIAEQREIFVAFANGAPQTDQFKFRAYALFAEDENQNLVQLSNWAFLPLGLVFAPSSFFNFSKNYPILTVFEVEQTREFPVKSGSGPATNLPLPFVSFGAEGEVTQPQVWHAHSSNIGIVEGSASLLGQNGSDTVLPGEFISIAYHTGLARVITD
ncbi:MAG: prepilin-type N-terminal cleavage/methylation domain-containing protein [Verrucomicrobiota bacterium]